LNARWCDSTNELCHPLRGKHEGELLHSRAIPAGSIRTCRFNFHRGVENNSGAAISLTESREGVQKPVLREYISCPITGHVCLLNYSWERARVAARGCTRALLPSVSFVRDGPGFASVKREKVRAVDARTFAVERFKGVENMRLKPTVIPLLLLVAVAIAPLFAFAKDSKDSEHITLSDPVVVAGTQLKAGDYHVTWEGTGSVVQVTFKRGDKVFVTTPARLVNEPSPYDGAIQMKTGNSDVRVLEGIQWKKKSLIFDQTAAGG
jgi:hypothetical protein